jgi:tetratricopeptide (TPR) repeat protein
LATLTATRAGAPALKDALAACDLLRAQATAERERARFASAEALLLRALALGRRRLGRRHPEVAWTLNDLGVLHKAQGRYADAARRYRLALQLLVDHHGDEAPELAPLYHNLGGLEHARGRYHQGEPLARRAVALRRRARPPDPFGVAVDLAALGRQRA